MPTRISCARSERGPLSPASLNRVRWRKRPPPIIPVKGAPAPPAWPRAGRSAPPEPLRRQDRRQWRASNSRLLRPVQQFGLSRGRRQPRSAAVHSPRKAQILQHARAEGVDGFDPQPAWRLQRLSKQPACACPAPAAPSLARRSGLLSAARKRVIPGIVAQAPSALNTRFAILAAAALV